MRYQPEGMWTAQSVALEEVGRVRLENQALVQACLLCIGAETPIWLAERIALAFGLPPSVLALARNANDVRRLAAESYLIASKKGTKWAIKRALRLVGIEVELIESFGAMYNGEHEYGGVITHAGESAGVFHVRAVVLNGEMNNAVRHAIRDMLPVRCYLAD